MGGGGGLFTLIFDEGWGFDSTYPILFMKSIEEANSWYFLINFEFEPCQQHSQIENIAVLY